MKKRAMVNLALALAVVILAGIGWRWHRDRSAAAESDRWQTHSYIVIQQLDQLLSDLTDAETGERGFVITGARNYLGPYQEALVRVDQKLASLRSLTRDNPSQQKRLAATEPLIRAKLAALKETIDLRATKGFDPAREIVMTGRDKALMDQVRQQVAKAQAEEGRLLKESSLAKEADLRRTSQIVIIGSVFSCIFLVTAVLLLQGEIARRLGVEQELLKHRDHLEELVASRTKELGRLNRTLKALSSSDQALIRSEDESQFLGEVCQIIVRDCGHALVWIGYAEGDEAKKVRPVAHAGFEAGYLETLNITWADTERGRGPTGTAIRTGKPCHCKDMLRDPGFGPWREQALKLGYASSLALPLMTGGRAFGAITIYSRQAGAFAEDEVELLGDLADDLAYGIGALRLRAEHARAEGELRRNEARRSELASFPELNPNPILESDMDGQVLYLNQAARHLFADVEKQGLGHPWLAGLDSVGKALQTGTEFSTSRDVEAGGRWYRQSIHYVRETGRIRLYGLDITESKRAEQRMDLLAETAGELLTTDSPQGVVERLCRKVLGHLDCEVFFNFLVDEQAGRLRLNACAGIPEAEAEKMQWLDYGTAVCGCAARDRCRIVAENIGETPDPRTELVKSYGIRAYACHPLMVQGRVLGTLSFGTRTRARFTEEELSLMEAVAGQVAIAMDRQQTQAALKAANEELEQRVAARTAALGAAERYARSLLEASLDPLVTISHTGSITDVNLATEAVTGVGRDQLIGSSFSAYFTEPELAEAGYHKVLETGAVSDYPLTIRHRSGRTTDVLYNATIYRNEAGEAQGVFAAARDITERKQTERRQEFTNALLALFAQKATANEYLDALVGVIRQWTGCQSLGVRLLTEEEEIPYETWSGFEARFLDLERRLSVRHDSCLCTRAVTQVFEESDGSLLTPGGSVRSDDALAFLKGLAPEKQASYRGNCMKFGFASLAIIPIRYRKEIVGVIHLADLRPGQFPGAMVEFIESMTPLIGEAIHRFRTEAELTKHRDHLEVLVKQRTGELEAANARLQVEVAERKQAQETLQRMAEDLGRSNRDLEQFAYVASHDLQEPLRAVGGYAKLLERRFSGKLDAKGLEYIAGATDGAARMERLITDLLAFSRVGTRGGALVATDMNGLLAEALRNLEAAIQGAGAKVSSAPLPTLPADPTQMMQLFQNLIGNAIKFRGQCPPEIFVDARQDKGRWVFSVRDNGIGIEPQYFERIFQIFQRLHTRKRYPGTGIGLAICKRIVERHGGAIWVESQPGQGSTFYFSIPPIPGTSNTDL